MNYESIFENTNEKPLENIITDGGFCSIFRTIGCIGDSLASGELQSSGEKCIAHDYYEYSWGQFMARNIGTRVINFSKGGMTAHEFVHGFGDLMGFCDNSKLCQCYIIALGVNDINKHNKHWGSIQDIDLDDYKNNKDSFAGCYAKIIQQIKAVQPYARFFLMTVPDNGKKDEDARVMDAHADIIKEIANLFNYTYVLDFRKYAPVYDTKFRENFFLRSHMNVAGYLLTAHMIESYIDYIIRHNMKDFTQVGFIGTPYYEEEVY